MTDEIETLRETLEKIRNLGDLAEENAQLRALLRERDEEIQELRNARYTVAVEQESTRMGRTRGISEGFSKGWASGPIDRSKLKMNIQPKDTEFMLNSPARVKVMSQSGQPAPEHMFNVETRIHQS